MLRKHFLIDFIFVIRTMTIPLNFFEIKGVLKQSDINFTLMKR